jgi:hypothetical protein
MERTTIGPSVLPRADLLEKWADVEPKKSHGTSSCLMCHTRVPKKTLIRVYVDKYTTCEDCFQKYKDW